MKLNKTLFTMVELIVAVAILAILMTLLQPALNKSIESAHYVQCSSNLKSLHMFFELYVNDHQKYPYAFTNRDDSDIGGLSWDDAFGLTYDGRKLDYNIAMRWNNVTADPGMGSDINDLYLCPRDTIDRNLAGRRSRSYAYNVNQNSYNEGGFANAWLREPRVSVSQSEVPDPSKTFLLAEFFTGTMGSGGGATLGNTAYQYRIQTFYPIHRGNFNYLFADGHSENLFKDDTVNLSMSDYRSGKYWTRDPND